MISIVRVENEKQLKAFIEFPYGLYKDDRYWVPPLRKDMYHLFDVSQNPFWEHSERELLLAYRNEHLVGRIGAIVDRNFIDCWKENTGYFGFFECENDAEVARALYGTAEKFHREKGMSTFIGPMNPSTNDECGFLLEGYFSSPFIMMTYTPEYYHELALASGLTKAKDLYAYYVDTDDAPIEYLERITSIVRRRVPDLKLRAVNMKDFTKEVKKIREVYNDAWSPNWGSVAMTEAEFKEIAKVLKPLIIPDLVLIIEINNVPAAVSLSVPNYNEVLKRLNGKLGFIEMLKFLYYKRQITEARLVIMGVRKQFQKMGLESLLYLESFKVGKRLGYKGGELSWTLEDNYEVNNGIKKMGAKLYKKWRIYQGTVNQQ
ncbi:MAG: N-acetyltransferase [candidate division WOR-3 bacterium]|nr:MAG: N-acetyltransferase [candidate division WOR-3 bacterium]